ncbi:MAG: type II toxin-antitoxin system VapC family toxin [Candidatus Hadarchaeales archaeon]
MRFIDASVFLHAFLKPKRPLEPHEQKIKEAARSILRRVEEGERVLTTVVHLSEVVNILEDFLPLEEAHKLESAILILKSIRVAEVSKKLYLAALSVAGESKIGLNDALAWVVMQRRGISEIYSFDKGFDRLKVRRVTE